MPHSCKAAASAGPAASPHWDDTNVLQWEDTNCLPTDNRSVDRQNGGAQAISAVFAGPTPEHAMSPPPTPNPKRTQRRNARRGPSRGLGRALLTAFLVIVLAVGAGALAQAADSGGQEPLKLSDRTKAQTDEGLRNANERDARERDRRAKPEERAKRARSKTEFHAEGGTQALELAKEKFAGVVSQPAWEGPTRRLAAGQRLVKYFSDYSALIDGGSAPNSVVESSLPMRSTDETGQPAPVDLTLDHAGKGYKAKNAAGSVLPGKLGDGIEFPRSHVRLDVGSADPAAQLVDGKTFYADVAPDTDFMVAPTPVGVETFHQLRSAASPEDLPLKLNLPSGATLRAGQDGEGAQVINARGETTMSISQPRAVDADGQQVPTSYSVQGDSITLHVAHRSGDWMYPILVDPYVTDAFTSPVRNWYGWSAPANLDNSSGRMVSDPNYDTYKLYLRALVDPVQHANGEYKYNITSAYRKSFIWAVNYQMDFASGNVTQLGAGILTPWVGWEGPGATPSMELPSAYPENGVNRTICAAASGCAVDGRPGNSFGFFLQAIQSFKMPRDPRGGLVSAMVYRSDKDNPVTTTANDNLKNKWVPDNTPGTTGFSAHDDGLGIQTLTSVRPDKTSVMHPQGNVGTCAGPQTDPCPQDWGTFFTYNTKDLSEGANAFDLVATDVIGNTSKENNGYSINVDKSRPDSLGLSGSLKDNDNQVLGGQAYTLNVNAHDQYSGVQTVSIYVDDSSTPAKTYTNTNCPTSGCPKNLSSGTDPWTFNNTGEGPHTITVKAVDQVGSASQDPAVIEAHTATEKLNVISDQQLPSITNVRHQGLNAWNDANPINTTVAAHDDGSGIKLLKIQPDGTVPTKDFGCPGTYTSRCLKDQSNVFTYSSTGLPEGNNTLKAKAYDAVTPNRESLDTPQSTWQVKIDHTDPSPPQVSGTLKDHDGGIITDGTYALHVVATDAPPAGPQAPGAPASPSGVASVSFGLDPDSANPSPATIVQNPCASDGCGQTPPDWTLDTATANLSEGVHTVRVTVKDRVGRLKASDIRFIYDRDRPTLDPPVHVGLPSGWTRSAQPTVSVTGHDAGAGISSFTLTTPTVGTLIAPGSKTQTRTLGCPGTIAAPCPHDATSQPPFTYSTDADSGDSIGTSKMPEGINRPSLTAHDAAGRDSLPPQTWPVKVDRSGPDIQTSGAATTGVPLFANGALRVDAADGSTDSDLTQRAGVQKIKILTDGIERDPQFDEKTQSCDGPCGDSRPLSFDWVYPTDRYQAGQHTITVVAIDQAGNESRKDIQILSGCSQQSVTGTPDPLHAGCPVIGEQDTLGLEDWFSYKSITTGAGTRAHVNLQTGNLVWNAIPVVNPGRGLSTFANVTYNSQVRIGDLYGDTLPGQPVPLRPAPGAALPDKLNPNQLGSGELGPGFSIGVSGVTRLNEPLDVTKGPLEIGLTDPDGTRHTFSRKSPLAAFQSPPGVHLYLREYTNSADLQGLRLKYYAMTRPDGVTYFFDPLGYATSIEDRNGNVLTYNYELNQSVTSLVPSVPCQRGLTVSAAVCRVSSITDATGTVANGRLLQVKYESVNTDPGSLGAGSLPILPKISQLIDHKSRVTGFRYNASGQLDQLTEGADINASAGPGYSGGRTFGFHWTDGTAEDPARIDAITDPRGNNTVVGYDDGKTGPNLPAKVLAGILSPRRVSWIADRDQTPAIPSASNASASDSYKKTGFAYESNKTDQPDPNGGHKGCLPVDPTHQSDCFNYATVTDQRGFASNFMLDARGRAVQSTDPRQAKTQLSWDTDNNVKMLKEAAGSPDETSSTMTYNPNGLLTSKTDPLGHTTKRTYRDWAGTQTADPVLHRDGCYGPPTGDVNGDPARCAKFVSDALTSTSARGDAYTYTYHPTDQGNNEMTDDPEGGHSHTAFGPHGEIISETDQVGNLTQYPIANFDASGLPQTKLDPRLKKWQYRYDAAGNVVSVTDPRGSSTDPGTPYTTTLTYDSFDRLREQHIPKDSSDPNAPESTRFITKKTQYDPNDNSNQTTDGTGAVGAAHFSPMDQPDKVTSPAVRHAGEGTVTTPEISTYVYDPAQHLVEQTKPMGTRPAVGTRPAATPGSFSTKYVLDENGRPVVEIHRSRGSEASSDQTDLLTSYAYDLRGNMTHMVDPNNNAGNGATHESDAEKARTNATSDCQTACRFIYEYDLANNRTSSTEDPGPGRKNLRTQTAYDNDNNKTSMTDPRGTKPGATASDYTTEWTYDKRDLLTGENKPHGGINPSDGLTAYHRRADGKVDQAQTPNHFKNGSGFTTNYSYWPTGELKSRTLPEAPNNTEYATGKGQVQYGVNAAGLDTIDDVGNATTITDGRGNSFANTFYDSGELKSTNRPSWWTYDPKSAPALKERSPQEQAQAAQQGGSGGPPSGALQGNFGSAEPVPMPDLLPKAGHTDFAYDGEMRLNGVSDAVNSNSTLTYDALGRMSETSQPFDLSNSDTNLRTITQKMGYDYNGNLVETTNGEGKTTTSTVDQFDRSADQSAPGAVEAPGGQVADETSHQHYDANGNPVRTLDPRGHVTTTGYDALDRALTSTAPGTRVTSYTYDDAGNKTSQTSPKGNADGLSAADKATFTTSRTFDGRNQPLKETNGLGEATVSEYDSNGNPVKTTKPAAQSSSSADPQPQVTTTTYDGRDLPWAKTTSGDQTRTSVTEFDQNANPRRTVNPSGVGADGTPSTTDPGTDLNPDSDANKSATVRQYSPDNLPVKTWLPWDSNDAPTTRIHQDFTLDALGRTKSVSAPTAASTPPDPTKYDFYDNGWTKTSSDPALTDGGSEYGQTITYSYDRRGNQTRWNSTTANGGPTREMSRDFYPNGLMKSRSATAPGQPDRSYSYYYNPDHSLVRTDDVRNKPTGNPETRTAAITYDGAERPTLVNQTGGPSKDTTTSYDLNDNVTQRQTDGITRTNPSDPSTPAYDGGKKTDYTFDVLDRELSMHVTKNPNPDGTTDPEPARTFTNTYWPSGDIQDRTRQQGNGTTVKESSYYFANGQLARKERRKPDGSEYGGEDTTNYTYSANGNATQDERGTHDYNARDQETSWTRASHYGWGSGKTINYTLDPSGQITHSTDNASPATDTSYTYLSNGGSERLHKTTTSSGGQRSTMYSCYDPFGSTTKITDQKAVDGSDNGNCDQNASSAQTTRYWYDPFERVTKTQAAAPATAESYSYDGLDRRETKCSADTAENCPTGKRSDYSYVGLSSKLSSQKPDGTAATDKTMSWDYSSSMEPMGMSAKDAGGTMKYRTYAKDANGSVTGLEDQTGNIAGNDRYHYDPYGDLQSTNASRPTDPAATENSLSAEAKGNPMRFEGFYYDSGVKTYDMQARRYRPDTGRFLSQDRYQAAQGDVNLQADPLTQNRYAFAGGNPTNNIEFDGHRQATLNEVYCIARQPQCRHTRPHPELSPEAYYRQELRRDTHLITGAIRTQIDAGAERRLQHSPSARPPTFDHLAQAFGFHVLGQIAHIADENAGAFDNPELKLLRGPGKALEQESARLLEQSGAGRAGAGAAKLSEAERADLYRAGAGSSSSTKLGSALGEIGRAPGEEAHHLVPVGQYARYPAVRSAQATLQRFGIAANDAANGVFLPGKYHRTIHTQIYFNAVAGSLRDAETADQAKAVLGSIATELRHGTFPTHDFGP